jgi:hypothetical protein
MSLILIIGTLLLPRSTSGGGTKAVSIINLIATPEKYHDEKVIIKGYAVLEFEGDAIYLSKEDAEYGITRNALYLDVDAEQLRNYQKDSQGYVLVEGKFDANSHGHLALFSGVIKEITRFEKLWKQTQVGVR